MICLTEDSKGGPESHKYLCLCVISMTICSVRHSSFCLNSDNMNQSMSLKILSHVRFPW
jgi:hypothetical protein